MADDPRWRLQSSGYAPGSYDLVQAHLQAVDKAICELAERYAEERSAAGPIIVTCDDVRKAIENYEV